MHLLLRDLQPLTNLAFSTRVPHCLSSFSAQAYMQLKQLPSVIRRNKTEQFGNVIRLDTDQRVVGRHDVLVSRQQLLRDLEDGSPAGLVRIARLNFVE